MADDPTPFWYEQGKKARKPSRVERIRLAAELVCESNGTQKRNELLQRLLKMVLRALPQKQVDKIITDYRRVRKIRNMGDLS